MLAGVTLLVISAAGCGSTAAPRVSKDDQQELYYSLIHDNRPLGSPPAACVSITRPLTPSARAAYTLILQVAAKNPRAMLQNPNDNTDVHSVGSYAGQWAHAMRFCVAHERRIGAGWRRMSARMTSATKDYPSSG
jgi:hypothetical protein